MIMTSFPTSGAAPMTIAAVTIWLALCVDVGTCFVTSSSTIRHQLHAYIDQDTLIHPVINDIVPLEDDILQVVQDSVVEDGSKPLKKLSFESDIQDRIDIDRPYYALKNETNIIDTNTDEPIGFVCTVQGEMPVLRENAGVSFGEVGRHTAAAATVAASHKNPIPGRFHYLANEYEWKVMPREGNMPQELSELINKGEFSLPKTASDECIIFCKCNEVTKRSASTTNYFVTNDAIYLLELQLSIVSARAFKTVYSANKNEDGEVPQAHHNPYPSICRCKSPFNYKYYNADGIDGWVTVEASLDKVKSSDCFGHFYQGCKVLANPHSLMLLHNGDLIGEAISKLTDRNIPFNFRANEHHDADDQWGMKMINWKCTPENLHFANGYGLHFQVRVYHDAGRMGEAGSRYNVQCQVTEEETNVVSYKSSGTFVLEPVS